MSNTVVDALSLEVQSNLYTLSQEYWDARESIAGEALKECRLTGTDDDASRAWFLGKVAEIRRLYLNAWEKLREEQFYEAWCILERIEINCAILKANPFFSLADFKILELADTVAVWQSIFPYTLFFSPEFIIKRKTCSICGLTVGPWSKCEHEPNKVYAGLLCIRNIEEVTALGMSIVENPVQKYSVCFLNDGNGQTDHYDYELVRFVRDRLSSPYDYWSHEVTTAYHPHELFSDFQLEGKCPCESGRIYEQCCHRKPGVLRPHHFIGLEKQPPSGYPQILFSGSDGATTELESVPLQKKMQLQPVVKE